MITKLILSLEKINKFIICIILLLYNNLNILLIANIFYKLFLIIKLLYFIHRITMNTKTKAQK